MKNTIYLLIGVPASGKTWVCRQVMDKFEVVENDLHIGKDYLGAIKKAAKESAKPVLCEAPFGIRAVMEPLEACGFTVKPVFIVEDEYVLQERYFRRANKLIPPGHLTRQKTYKERALAMKATCGPSSVVLAYLRGVS